MFLSFGALEGCHFQKNKIPSLQETYRKNDKRPFGSFIAFKEIQYEFPGYFINVADQPFDEIWDDVKEDADSTYSLYFIVTKNLILTPDEVHSMLDYIKSGNDLFISADFIDRKLLDAFYCDLDRNSEIMSEVLGKMQETKVSMFFGNDFKTPQYGYYYFPFLNYFSDFDTATTRVLGVNQVNLPNYVILFYGKGRLYLHTAPRAFSNYFLLTSDNYKYFEGITSYLRFNPQYIYWDEFYKNYTGRRPQRSKKGETSDFSSLKIINGNPSLSWAFYLALAGILLFVIFNSKRKQRPVPVKELNTNTTVLFAETIGNLYLQHKNNRNMADKIITYFYEYLRRKYLLNTAIINKDFIVSLSGKSGVTTEETESLFGLIEAIQHNEEVTDEQLLTLREKVENFKNKK